MLIASTGLRKGEALALRWDRVDLDAGVLRVAATIGRIGDRLVISEPKTDRARRTVPLSPAVVAMLRRHRTEQKAERLRAGDQWTETGLVFTTELGAAVDPRNFLRVIEAAAKTAGADGCRRAHAAAQRGGVLAGGRRAHQGGGRSARALLDQRHRRRLRAHQRRRGTGGSRRAEHRARH